jgi:hypothetical protein
MKKMITVGSIVLLSAVFAAAQYANQSSASNQSDMNSSKTIVEGCLSQTASGYILASNSGTTYKLVGDTSKLQAHVGHTVQLTGTTNSTPVTGAMAKQEGSMSGVADTQKTLSVTSLKHVNVGCKTAQ